MKLLRQARQQQRSNAYVTIAHYQNVMARFTHQPVQAEGLGVGNGRLSGYHQARVDPAAELIDNFFGDGNCWVVPPMDAEKHFIYGIVLQEKATEAVFQAVIVAAERLKNADGWLASGRRRASREEPPRGNNNQRAIDERTGEQDRQYRGENYHNAGLFSMLEPSAVAPERPLV